MTMSESLHERPPAWMRDIYKTYQKLGRASLEERPDLIDLKRTDEAINNHLNLSKVPLLPTKLRKNFEALLSSGQGNESPSIPLAPPKVLEVAGVPGKPSTPHHCYCI
jgi:hypothetical protein